MIYDSGYAQCVRRRRFTFTTSPQFTSICFPAHRHNAFPARRGYGRAGSPSFDDATSATSAIAYARCHIVSHVDGRGAYLHDASKIFNDVAYTPFTGEKKVSSRRRIEMPLLVAKMPATISMSEKLRLSCYGHDSMKQCEETPPHAKFPHYSNIHIAVSLIFIIFAFMSHASRAHSATHTTLISEMIVLVAELQYF